LPTLPTDVFSVLVIMALVSTFIATPLIRWLMNATLSGRRASIASPRSAAARSSTPLIFAIS